MVRMLDHVKINLSKCADTWKGRAVVLDASGDRWEVINLIEHPCKGKVRFKLVSTYIKNKKYREVTCRSDIATLWLNDQIRIKVLSKSYGTHINHRDSKDKYRKFAKLQKNYWLPPQQR